jgi:predicted MFS family arabinose efflux permease
MEPSAEHPREAARKPLSEGLLVFILGLAGFCGALATRIVDPMVPDIGRDLMVEVTTAALLSSAFTMPYAFGQPILGPLGDAFGKAFVIKICMAVMAVTLLISAAMPSFSGLFALRLVAGFAGGGVIPLGMAMLGDRFTMARRQIAISRFLVMTLSGQAAGAALAGFLVSLFGWRFVFVGAGLISLAALAALLRWLAPRPGAKRGRFDLGEAFQRYAGIFANPRAKICFSAVFIEGIAVYGMLPHIAHILEQLGKGSAREAGIVISGMGLGGIVYAAIVPMLLRRLGMYGVMGAGGFVAAAGLAAAGFELGLPVGFLAFCVMGIGFYMVHNSLQTQASELSATARGSAMALHAFFFFVGQALGPVVFGYGLTAFGTRLPLFMAAVTIGVLGLVASRALQAAARSAPAG